MIKIYVACGLTHVPRKEFQDYVQTLHALVAHLSCALPAQVKYALRDSDPQLAEKPLEDRARLCYLWDREMVEWADVVVAEASYPSTGLGIELQVACARDTPIIIAFRPSNSHRAAPIQYETPDQAKHDLQVGEGFVSLMALGLPSVFKVLRYSNVEEAVMKIEEAIRIVQRER